MVHYSRRHSNTTGYRQIKRGRTVEQVERIAKKVGGESMQSKTVPDDVLQEQREKIAKKNATDRLLTDVMKVTDDLRKRRAAYAWTIATEISTKLRHLARNGFSIGRVVGKYGPTLENMVKVDFLGREYTDETGKRRVHRVSVVVGFEDHRSEGDCNEPDCEGEYETQVLDNDQLAVICNECGKPYRPAEQDSDELHDSGDEIDRTYDRIREHGR